MSKTTDIAPSPYLIKTTNERIPREFETAIKNINANTTFIKQTDVIVETYNNSIKEKLLNLLLPHVKLELIEQQPIALDIYVLHCHCDLQIGKETFDELKEYLKNGQL